MTWYITVAVQLVKAYKRALTRKWSFLGLSLLTFVASVGTLRSYDLLPNPPKFDAAPAITLAASAVALASSTPEVIVEDPVKIEIPKISLVATISDPTTTDTEVLDKGLLKGAVRYPTSAKLGEVGNVVLFGHSSYLPIVGNQAYKTFNGIQKLVAGDVVTVYSAGTAYTYRVRSMQKESAATDAGIDLAVIGRVLTLATCNSFATKSDRFVVTADFVESHPISS
jgi:LPXTG-site transpeptidase (sortase) family protein